MSGVPAADCLGCRTELLTWALVGLRVSLGRRPPGVTCALPRLGSLGVGGPVVVGAAPGVLVPRRPGVITVTGLAGEEQEGRQSEAAGSQRLKSSFQTTC